MNLLTNLVTRLRGLMPASKSAAVAAAGQEGDLFYPAESFLRPYEEHDVIIAPTRTGMGVSSIIPALLATSGERAGEEIASDDLGITIAPTRDGMGTTSFPHSVST